MLLFGCSPVTLPSFDCGGARSTPIAVVFYLALYVAVSLDLFLGESYLTPTCELYSNYVDVDIVKMSWIVKFKSFFLLLKLTSRILISLKVR